MGAQRCVKAPPRGLGEILVVSAFPKKSSSTLKSTQRSIQKADTYQFFDAEMVFVRPSMSCELVNSLSFIPRFWTSLGNQSFACLET